MHQWKNQDIWCAKKKQSRKTKIWQGFKNLSHHEGVPKDVEQKDWEIMFLGRAVWAQGHKVAELGRKS
jgi:hypothetical protein